MKVHTDNMTLLFMLPLIIWLEVVFFRFFHSEITLFRLTFALVLLSIPELCHFKNHIPNFHPGSLQMKWKWYWYLVKIASRNLNQGNRFVLYGSIPTIFPCNKEQLSQFYKIFFSFHILGAKENALWVSRALSPDWSAATSNFFSPVRLSKVLFILILLWATRIDSPLLGPHRCW